MPTFTSSSCEQAINAGAYGVDQVSAATAILSEQQAADLIGVRVETLRAWACRRKGPPRLKLGRRVAYRAEALERWILSRETDPAAARRGR